MNKELLYEEVFQQNTLIHLEAANKMQFKNNAKLKKFCAEFP